MILNIMQSIHMLQYHMGYFTNCTIFMFSYINLKINLKPRDVALLLEYLLALLDTQHHTKPSMAYTPVKLVFAMKAERSGVQDILSYTVGSNPSRAT